MKVNTVKQILHTVCITDSRKITGPLYTHTNVYKPYMNVPNVYL